MDILDAAWDAMRATLSQERIGTAVACRVVAQAPLPAADATLARLLADATATLGSMPEQLMAEGSFATGQVTTLLRFVAGQMALVTVVVGETPAILTLHVFGSRGIVSWNAADGDALAVDGKSDDAPSDLARSLVQFVHQSASTGKPVMLGENGGRHQPAGTAAANTGRPKPVEHASSRTTQGERSLRAVAPPYGVLLVTGSYSHQEDYARMFKADPRCRLVGVTDEADITPRRRALNKRLADELGIPLLPDLSAALARDDVHIASICAEPERRGKIIVKCAAAGKHLYLDKPLVASLAEADAAVAAIHQAGVVSHMFSQAHWATAARVRQIVESGELGTLSSLHFDLTFAKGPAGGADLSRRRRESPRPTQFEGEITKRELTNVGVYPLVLLHWLLGERVRRVYAATGNFFFSEHQLHNHEDFGQILLTTESGVTVSITAGRTGWQSHPAGGMERVCLVGSKGARSLDGHRPRLDVWTEEPAWPTPPYNAEDPMGFWSSSVATLPAKRAWTMPSNNRMRDVSYFLDCIQHGHTSDVSVELAAATTEVLLAAYQSAATGEVVTLPLPRSGD